MSKTDKDDPVWVKALAHPDQFQPWHHWTCEHSFHRGDRACDLPDSPPTEQFHTRETYCSWWFMPEGEAYGEVYHSMPKHGCDNDRCTNCTAKKTAKRRDRNEGKRALRKLIEEEIL